MKNLFSLQNALELAHASQSRHEETLAGFTAKTEKVRRPQQSDDLLDGTVMSFIMFISQKVGPSL